MTSPGARIGTRSAIDFMYWVQRQIGDRFITGTPVGLNSNSRTMFDASELVQWGAAQAGAFMPNRPDDQIEYCRTNGTEIAVADGIATRGAILWNNNRIAISLGRDTTIEEQQGRVGIVNGGAARRYVRAGRIPGLRY